MRNRLVVSGLAVLGLAVTAAAATLVVDLNGAGEFTDIQAALDAAADGETVLVKPGEYVITESIDFNRLRSPDNPASPPLKNIVVRSEGGADATVIRMADPPAHPKQASVVLFAKGETLASVLDGFTITGGKGTRFEVNLYGERGGGVFCTRGSSPTIANCRITGNSATDGGGAGGKDMGAALGTCDAVGWQECRVHLRAGTHPTDFFSLLQHASIEGAGQATTVIEGTVYGLRTAMRT